MAHSNQLREFVLSDKGIQLLDVYKGKRGSPLRLRPDGAGEPRELPTGSIRTRRSNGRSASWRARELVMENEIALSEQSMPARRTR